jgi:hypothetical protein
MNGWPVAFARMPRAGASQPKWNADMRGNDLIFEPQKFWSFAIKNRLFRTNITGRFDNAMDPACRLGFHRHNDCKYILQISHSGDNAISPVSKIS